MERTYILLIAFLLDVVFKDPAWLYHPVQAVGFIAAETESFFRTLFKRNLKVAGVCFLVFQLLFWFAIYVFVIGILGSIGFSLAKVFLVYLTYSLLAFGSLTREVSKVKNFLEKGDLNKARKVLQGMVSLDVSTENEHGVVRATIETTTENISDGIIAPLFYFAIGGPLLMWKYKIVNTLDSTVGYKNEKYRDFGWASARLDDVLNFIPARLTGLLVVVTAFILRDNPCGAWRAWMRDGQKGPSPNGGIPITAFAGARNIALGGLQTPKGGTIPFVGGNKKDFGAEELTAVLYYIHVSSIVMILAILTYLVL